MSLIDYICRWLGITFLPGYKEASQGQPLDAGASAPGKSGSPPTSDDLGETKPIAKKAGGQQESEGQDANASTAAASHNGNGHSNGHSNGHASNGHGSNGNGHAAGAKPASDSAGGVVAEISAKLLERAGVSLGKEGPMGEGVRNEQFAGFQADAPSCDNCGSITVRNGNCYLCHNCGASMGCS